MKVKELRPEQVCVGLQVKSLNPANPERLGVVCWIYEEPSGDKMAAILWDGETYPLTRIEKEKNWNFYDCDNEVVGWLR